MILHQFVLGVALVAGEDAESTTTVTVGEDNKLSEVKDTTTKDEEGSTKSPEKRGLFRMTGVHGENPQYQFVYTVPQQGVGYQQPQVPVAHQYEPRSIPTTKYEHLYVKPLPYNAQPTFQQQYVLPSPSAAPYNAPFPYATQPTTMVLLMTPPNPSNPYGSLMLLPLNSIIPQYTPNHILPYQAPPRVPVQFVPQYIPVPVKGYNQNAGFPAAHFKGSDYPQKSAVLPTPQYQSYQEQSASAEEQDQSTIPPSPNYSNRGRPIEQYVKG